jgi:hypothetical protein
VRKLEPKEVFSYGKYKKRCNYPNSLIDKEKAIISDGLSSVAPLIGEMLQPFSLVELAKIRKENIKFTY